MRNVHQFEPQVAMILPATHALLSSANLVVHSAVSQIYLHGSRGLSGGYRPDSDIDLSLIVETKPSLLQSDLEVLLSDVVQTTLANWKGAIEVDLAGVFDARNCGLKCFGLSAWDENFCPLGGVDCFGLYKIQKGFNGLVTNAGVQVKRMLPCLKIWQRP